MEIFNFRHRLTSGADEFPPFEPLSVANSTSRIPRMLILPRSRRF